MIKKYLTALLMTAVMGVMIPLTAVTADAQTRRYYSSRTRTTYVRTKRPNFYKRHRKVMNIAIGSAAGMLVGGLIGGKKGLVIGGLAGAGGGAIVNSRQRSRHYGRQVYYRPVYRNY
jgi:uncharacterized protein YcfJ